MQKHEVFITRTHVVNTRDAWRESKQTDKASIELASRANHPKVKELLVKLLNENQYEVQAIHDAVKGEYFRPHTSTEGAEQGTNSRYGIDGDQNVLAKMLVDDGDNHGKHDVDEYDDDDNDNDDNSEDDDDDGGDDDDGDDDGDEDYFPSEDEGAQDTEGNTIQSSLWPPKRRADDIREILDPDLLAFEAILKLPYDYTYTINDLDEPEVFIRAIKLLYNARMGRVGSISRTSLHLKYDQLHESVVESIGKKMRLGENDIAALHLMEERTVCNLDRNYFRVLTNVVLDIAQTSKKQPRELKEPAATKKRISAQTLLAQHRRILGMFPKAI